MINFDNYANENKTKHNKNWPYIPDHPYRILIIGGSGSRKTNLVLNLIENQPDIDKIYLYAKNPCESKYPYLINKREGVGINHFNDPKAFIEYSNDIHYVYKENKILIVFDDMVADMIYDKKLNSVATELFIRGRKLNISLVCITESYFKVPKDVRLNTSHFFIAKIPNKRELQLQYDINREAIKISALSSGKIHKCEYLTGEDILPSNQQQIIEQAKFTYSPLGNPFEKQIKTIEYQEKNKLMP